MPNADPAQQRALLEVQALDTRSRQLTHRGASLPEHATLAAAEQTRAELAADLQTVEQTVAGLGRDLRRAEGDVEDVRTRITRNQARLDAGTGSPKDLTALQHELGTLGARQNTLEEVELEVMEALENATTERDRLLAAVAETDATIAATTTDRDAALAEIDAEQQQVAAERERAVAGLDAGLLGLYDRIGSRTAVAAAELTGNRCGACRMELSPVDLARIHALPAEAVAQCEECGAVLVR